MPLPDKRSCLLAALAHNPTNLRFNPHLRQFFHIADPIAAKMGREFIDALDHRRDTIGARVAANKGERHLRPLFDPATAP